MGQYYKAINIDVNEVIEPWDYDNGSKLMEHSYINNTFVEAVELLLYSDEYTKGRWAEQRIVWAGDYADVEPDSEDNLYQQAESYLALKNLVIAVPSHFIYLVNLDKFEYVNKLNCPINELSDSGPWIIHPLPLLTAEGNGRGGGDYRGSDEFVGRWARNRIALVKDLPANYTEIFPNFRDR